MQREVVTIDWRAEIKARQAEYDGASDNRKAQDIGVERNLLADLGAYSETLLFELLQNADDSPRAANGSEPPINRVTFELSGDAFLCLHHGKPFSRADLEGITSIYSSNPEKRAVASATGYKGIGFKSIFNFSEEVAVAGGGSCRFRFSKRESKRRQLPWLRYPYPLSAAEWEGLMQPFSTPGGSEEICFVAQLVNDRRRVELERCLRDLQGHPEWLYFLRHVRQVAIVIDGACTCIRIERAFGRVLVLASGQQRSHTLFERRGVTIPEQVQAALREDNLAADAPQRIRDANTSDLALVLYEDGAEPSYNFAATLPMKRTDYGLPFIVQANFLPDTDRSQIRPGFVANEWLLEVAGGFAAVCLQSLWPQDGAESAFAKTANAYERTLTTDSAPEEFKRGFDEALGQRLRLPDASGALRSPEVLFRDPLGLAEVVQAGELGYPREWENRYQLHPTVEQSSPSLAGRVASVLTLELIVERVRSRSTSFEQFDAEFATLVEQLADWAGKAGEADANELKRLLTDNLYVPVGGESIASGRVCFGVPEVHVPIYEACHEWRAVGADGPVNEVRNSAFKAALLALGARQWNEVSFAKKCHEERAALATKAATDWQFSISVWRSLFHLRDAVPYTSGRPIIHAETVAGLPIPAIEKDEPSMLPLSRVRLQLAGELPEPYRMLYRERCRERLSIRVVDVAALAKTDSEVSTWRDFLVRVRPELKWNVHADAHDLLRRHAKLGTGNGAIATNVIAAAVAEYLRSAESQQRPLPFLGALLLPTYRANPGRSVSFEKVRTFAGFEHGERVYPRHPEYPAVGYVVASRGHKLAAPEWPQVGHSYADLFGHLRRELSKVLSTEDVLSGLARDVSDNQLNALTEADDQRLTLEIFDIHLKRPDLRSKLPYRKLRFRAESHQGLYLGYWFIPSNPPRGDVDALLRCKRRHALRLCSQTYGDVGRMHPQAWAEFTEACGIVSEMEVVAAAELRQPAKASRQFCLDLPVIGDNTTSAAVVRAYGVDPKCDIMPSLALAAGNAVAVEGLWEVLSKRDDSWQILSNSHALTKRLAVFPSTAGPMPAAELYSPDLRVFSPEVQSRRCSLAPSVLRSSVELKSCFRPSLTQEDFRAEICWAAQEGGSRGLEAFRITLKHSLQALQPPTSAEPLFRDLEVPTLGGSFLPPTGLTLLDQAPGTEQLTGYLAQSVMADRFAILPKLNRELSTLYTDALSAAGCDVIGLSSWTYKSVPLSPTDPICRRINTCKHELLVALASSSATGAPDLEKLLNDLEIESCREIWLECDAVPDFRLSVRAHLDLKSSTLLVSDETDLLQVVFDPAFSEYRGDNLSGPIRLKLTPRGPEQANAEMVAIPKLNPVAGAVEDRSQHPQGAAREPKSTEIASTTQVISLDGQPQISPQTNDASPGGTEGDSFGLSPEQQEALMRGLEALGLDLDEDASYLQHTLALGLAADHLAQLGGSVEAVAINENAPSELWHRHKGQTRRYLVSSARYGLLHLSTAYWRQLAEGGCALIVVESKDIVTFDALTEVLQRYGQQQSVLRAERIADVNVYDDALVALSAYAPHALFLVPDSAAETQLKAVFNDQNRGRATGGGGTDDQL